MNNSYSHDYPDDSGAATDLDWQASPDDDAQPQWPPASDSAMTAETPSANPYHDRVRGTNAPETARAPFVGRAALLGRLYATLTDANGARAAGVMGGSGMGKTAFLRATEGAYGESVIGVYIPLSAADDIRGETDFILLLAAAITETLRVRGFSLSRLANLQAPGENPGDARLWWSDHFLPAVLALIRAQERGRRLTLLLDNATQWLMWVNARTLPADTFAFWRGVLDEFLPLAIVLAISDDEPGARTAFAPLIPATAEPLTLARLALDETRTLLQRPSGSSGAPLPYRVPDDAADAVHRATGGHPALVQAFGFGLFRRWQARPELNVLTLDDVKALTPEIVPDAYADYARRWARLNASERAVLTAISQSRYEDPLKRLDAETIAAWLAQTDVPLTAAAISSTLRSLEYGEFVQQTARQGVMLTAGMMQGWLLEHARSPRGGRVRAGRAEQEAERSAGRGAERGVSGERSTASATATTPDAANPANRRVPLRGIIAAGVGIGIVVAVAILLMLNVQFAPGASSQPPQPTVTLFSGE